MWKEFGVNILKTILVHHTLGTFLRKGKTKRNLYENMYYTNESKWYGNGNKRESEREQGVGKMITRSHVRNPYRILQVPNATATASATALAL